MEIELDSEHISEEWEKETEVPNAETVAALKEVGDMKSHPEQYKSYTDAAEMMKDLLSE